MERETPKTPTPTPYTNIYAALNNKKTNDEVASKVTEELNKLKIAEEKDNKIVSREKPEMMSLNTLVEMCSAGEKPTKGKSEKDIRKKKAPVLVDDNQSYVMIGPPSEPVEPPATLSTETSKTNAIEESTVKRSEALSAYIGVATLNDAENHLTRRGEFALYHLFNPNGRLDTITEKLPLMIVYRTTTKKNRHYSIRTTCDQQFFVDCGYPNVRKHYSLNHLVKFYKTSATCEINPYDTSADSFSWWLE
ncbi:SH2 domain-containing protein [Caenorhabditis elegans]|uniref:SH2 domain-containing protein n=1 Tax=Caenorhabditis elegans TaxID=6239 RepID=O01434_CAEEL|nr:SH2 domain-containing protein [Caenorhabditis elegans]CCD61327.1 SH2 domain-containing protein [Caenorhabditis elegans]|eukprot:NP_491721.2 Uncharacterized protein CELE_B0207.11 [Caenorhabditis elegans]